VDVGTWRPGHRLSRSAVQLTYTSAGGDALRSMLVDVALGINYAQGFDLNVDLHLVNVNDVSPPTVKLSGVKRNASLLSNFLLDNSLHFGVNGIISFQKLVGNIDKMTIANLGRQHQRSLNSYFKSS
jgi:hypothetical protein